MPNFSILFLDIDGTTIGRDHFTLSPHNREALLAAKAAGVILAMSTGRCLGIVPQQLFDVGFDYAITSNGAAVQDCAVAPVYSGNAYPRMSLRSPTALSAHMSALSNGLQTAKYSWHVKHMSNSVQRSFLRGIPSTFPKAILLL